MSKLSQLLNILIIGNPANAAVAARLKNVTIDANTGTVNHLLPGPDIALVNAANNGLLGQFRAQKVWSAVWNDYADFQLLNDRLVYGKCYTDAKNGAHISNSRCQMGVIGIASDTFGICVGQGASESQVPIAVSGWVLAYVDKEYPTGTPLTNDENGHLVEMTLQEKRDFPERLLAIYKKKEDLDFFGSENKKVKVDGRHWVMVK